MAELPVPELISLVEAFGGIATLFVIFFFSRKQMRNLSVDIETKVLNDLDQKMHEMGGMLVHRPELLKLLTKETSTKPNARYHSYQIRKSSRTRI